MLIKQLFSPSLSPGLDRILVQLKRKPQGKKLNLEELNLRSLSHGGDAALTLLWLLDLKKQARTRPGAKENKGTWDPHPAKAGRIESSSETRETVAFLSDQTRTCARAPRRTEGGLQKDQIVLCIPGIPWLRYSSVRLPVTNTVFTLAQPRGKHAEVSERRLLERGLWEPGLIMGF